MKLRQAIWTALALTTLSAGVRAESDAGSAPHHGNSREERAHIQQERQAIAARRARAEAACYQLFSVEDCLRDARTQARNAEIPLRQREVQLNGIERKQKAAERLRSIEERQRTLPDPALAPAAPRSVVRGKPALAVEQRAQRERDAQHRAEQQRLWQQTQATEQSRHAAETAARAAKARTRHAENLKAAQARRERLRKAQADAAAAGRKPTPPLPPVDP